MQTKQYSVKVFETFITDEKEFLSFFEKNFIFFKNHLLSISGNVTETIIKYLNENNLQYVVDMKLPSGKKEVIRKQAIPTKKTEENLKVIDKLVRSGQEIITKGDLLLLNRVNSGGSLIVHGNLIITQIVDGSIRCNGNFMMLKASQKANIIFHDVKVDNSYLQERLNRVELKNNEIIITPVLKETNWE